MHKIYSSNDSSMLNGTSKEYIDWNPMLMEFLLLVEVNEHFGCWLTGFSCMNQYHTRRPRQNNDLFGSSHDAFSSTVVVVEFLLMFDD